MPLFSELPFNARPDLTPYLIHLTKNTKQEMSSLHRRTWKAFSCQPRIGGVTIRVFADAQNENWVILIVKTRLTKTLCSLLSIESRLSQAGRHGLPAETSISMSGLLAWLLSKGTPASRCTPAAHKFSFETLQSEQPTQSTSEMPLIEANQAPRGQVDRRAPILEANRQRRTCYVN